MISKVSGYSNNFLISQSGKSHKNTYMPVIDTISFSGLKDKDTKCMFVFDLDGTFLEGSNDEIQKILKLQKDKNAVLIYATGKKITEFVATQEKLRNRGIILPTPEYLIANNGQFVYENIDGNLLEDKGWTVKLQTGMNFDKKVVSEVIKEIATTEYKFDTDTIAKIRSRDDFEKRKEIDGEFWNSKITDFNWNTSPFLLEYFISPDVDVEKLQGRIEERLKTQGVSAKFILSTDTKDGFDKWVNSISGDKNTLYKTRPFRENDEGIRWIYVCAADKADGIKYVQSKLKIPDNEILMAGNDCNDISMAELTKAGSFFVCVANAANQFKDFVLGLKSSPEHRHPDNLILPKNHGAAGIIEGINSLSP